CPAGGGQRRPAAASGGTANPQKEWSRRRRPGTGASTPVAAIPVPGCGRIPGGRESEAAPGAGNQGSRSAPVLVSPGGTWQPGPPDLAIGAVACLSSTCQRINMSHTTLAARTVKTPSGQISYNETGSGPVALFVHGVLLNKHLWRHQLTGLSDVRRCIALDLLAHGDTEIAA